MNAERSPGGAVASALARWACVSSVVALAGCAALRIDVDVYKGPLVNNENTQRDQVLSMALSAKPLLLEMRNTFLGEVKPGWYGDQPRLLREALKNNKVFDELLRGGLDKGKRDALRSARQLNGVLTFYEDVGDPALVAAARYTDERDRQVRELQRSLEAQARAGKLKWLTRGDSREYQLAHETQALVWNELVSLLQEVAADDGATGSQAGKALPPGQRELQQELAERIAERTQVRLVACMLTSTDPLVGDVARFRQAASERDDRALQTDRNAVWNGERYRQARRVLAHVLLHQPAVSASALKLLDKQARTTNAAGCTPEALSSILQGIAPETQLPWLRNTGIVSQPWVEMRPSELESGRSDIDDAPQPKSLAELVARTAALGTSGFDQGRTADGIDRIANRYAQARDAVNALSSNDTSEKAVGLRAEAQAQFRRVEHMLVDMAGRMQFLSTNLWLLKEDSPSGAERGSWDNALAPRVPGLTKVDRERYKSMLEAIANNLQVYADDLRNRADYAARQQKLGPGERFAASAAFTVTATGALDYIERSLKTASQGAAEKLETEVAELTQQLELERSRLKAERETRKGEWDRRQTLAGGLRALALTVGVGQAPKPAKAAKPAKPEKAPATAPAQADEKAADLAADAKLLRAQLTQSTEPVTIEALRKELADGLAALVQPAFKQLPRGVRLSGAVAGVQSMAFSSGGAAAPRKQQLDRLYQLIVQARDQAVAAAAEPIEPSDDGKAKKLAALLAEADGKRLGITGTQPSTADAKEALVQLARYRDELLKELTALAQPLDHKTVSGVVRNRLLAAQKAAASDSAEATKLAGALRACDAVKPPDVVQIANMAKDDDAIDVLDKVIAQLRYQLVQQTRLGERAAADTQAALERAIKDRERQIFVRPNSTYLRSAYALSFQQDDPLPGQRNMLMDQFKSLFISEDPVLAQTRADLDKAFWQNINTVRVSASGGSNFVLAKDDVGNWYVKALGADPTAMVNAAKGLALYNMGGRFNSNLLRVDELQQQLDAEKDPDKRAGLRTQLDAAAGPDGSAGVAARSETLELFNRNYDERTATHLKDLAARLGSDAFATALRERWAATLKDSPNPKALDKLLADTEVARQFADALARADTKKIGQPAADAIIASLQALQRARVALKTLVRNEVSLTAADVAALDAATAAENLATQKLADADKAVVSANQKLLDELAAQKAVDPKDSVKVAAASAAVDEARRVDALRRGEYAEARKVLADLGDKRKLAAAALATSQKRQLDATADVDTVLKAAVVEVVNLRLRVVEETETAVKVIGRGGS